MLQIGKNNDKKFQALENEILNLKNQYENKIKELEISIKNTQKTHEKVFNKQTTEKSLDQKISLLNESFIKFKTEFCIKKICNKTIRFIQTLNQQNQFELEKKSKES